ncbi:MAG: hypothetical protein PHE53_06715 [Thermoguttaceae bacterium]|nr:hypothetical protein [Thermoguttaceae bacterium]
MLVYTPDLLQETLEIAKQADYAIRTECFDGNGCESCVLHGKKIIFVDLALSPPDQFEQMLRILCDEVPETLQKMAKEGKISEVLVRRIRRQLASRNH